MAATAALGFRCLCLLLLVSGRGVPAQPATQRLEDGQSSSWAGAVDSQAETTPAATEGTGSPQVVMKVSSRAGRQHVSLRHREFLSPEEWASASVPDVPRLVALSAARLESGTACGEDSREFLRALNNFTLWAVNMYDASVRAPTGVEYGSVYQLGHFDQCVSVRAHAGRVRGQYCLPQLDVRPLPSQPHPLPEDPYILDFNQDQSAWLKLQFAGDRLKIRRDRWWWALCVPASCSPRQLQRALDQALRVAGPRMRMEMRAHLEDDYCTTDEPPPPTHATAIFVCVVAMLLVLVTIGSCYVAHMNKNDYPEKTKGYGRQIVECFSVQRNVRLLFSTNKSNMELEIFGVMRSFTMSCIIIGHRLLLYGGFPLYNGEAEDVLFRRPLGMLAANGFLVVDMCFTIGAMTLAIPLFQKFDRGAKFHHLFLEIINRYVRLTPLHAVVILFHCGVLPYMGSGPLWKSTVLQEQTRCETNWWTNILYVNNYVNAANMCMFQTWYMSADFHFFVVSLFLIYMIWRWPVAGWAAMGCITVISLVPLFLTIYLQNLPPFVMPYPDLVKNFREAKEYLRLYVPSHDRATPYLVGVIAGILIHRGKHLKRKLNEVQSCVLAITWCCITLALFFSIYVFFIPGRPYNALEAAIYGPLDHFAVAVLIGIYGSSSVISNSKILLNYLSAKPFAIIGKLSFAAYLIHAIPMLYDQGSLRQPRHVGVYQGVWLAVADICITYPVAAVLFVLVEAPFRGVIKVLLQRVK